MVQTPIAQPLFDRRNRLRPRAKPVGWVADPLDWGLGVAVEVDDFVEGEIPNRCICEMLELLQALERYQIDQ